MSGTEAFNDDTKRALDRLEAVLDRDVKVNPLKVLVQAISGSSKVSSSLKTTAIGFDSSVFMRLATHRRSADILDYLPSHDAPLVLPGQAVQEFWNNRLSVVDTISNSLKKKFDALAMEVGQVDPQFGQFGDKMREMLGEFHSEFGYIYDESTRENVSKMLAILDERAFCGFVPKGCLVTGVVVGGAGVAVSR